MLSSAARRAPAGGPGGEAGVAGRRRLVVLAALAGLAAVAGAAALVALSRGGDDAASRVEAGLTPAAYEAATGVRIVRASLVSGGGMVDVRYQVVDAGKLGEHATHMGDPLALVDPDTGAVLDQHWMGDLHRMRTPHEGAVYYALVINESGLLEPGETVSLRFLHAQLDGVTVK